MFPAPGLPHSTAKACFCVDVCVLFFCACLEHKLAIAVDNHNLFLPNNTALIAELFPVLCESQAGCGFKVVMWWSVHDESPKVSEVCPLAFAERS